MSDNDFEIGGRRFKLSKLDPFKQLHIVRRIGPILSELLPALNENAKKPELDFLKMPEAEKLQHVGKFAGPLMTGLSKLSDKDADFVLLGLLASAEIQQTQGNWARVATSDMLMFQDLQLPLLLQVAGRAFMYNLSGFFGALPHS